MEFGKLSAQDEVHAQVDEERRRRVAANHTGTHILHAVLRETLGTHVNRRGRLLRRTGFVSTTPISRL